MQILFSRHTARECAQTLNSMELALREAMSRPQDPKQWNNNRRCCKGNKAAKDGRAAQSLRVNSCTCTAPKFNKSCST